MESTATDRDVLIHAARVTLERLQAAEGIDEGDEGSINELGTVVNALAASIDFARLETDLLRTDAAASSEAAHNAPYIASNQALCSRRPARLGSSTTGKSGGFPGLAAHQRSHRSVLGLGNR